MNKVFYYEFLYHSDMALARKTANLLSSKLGIAVYPSMGMLSGSPQTHCGVYFEVDIKEQDEEKTIDNVIKTCMTGVLSTLGSRPTAEEYNAYPLTIFNKKIEEIVDTWYKLNQQSISHPEGGMAFSPVIYEKNGNVEISGTFVFTSTNETRAFLANDVKKRFIREMSKEFPNSKLHF